jgi:hypothetical protein
MNDRNVASVGETISFTNCAKPSSSKSSIF